MVGISNHRLWEMSFVFCVEAFGLYLAFPVHVLVFVCLKLMIQPG